MAGTVGAAPQEAKRRGRDGEEKGKRREREGEEKGKEGDVRVNLNDH